MAGVQWSNGKLRKGEAKHQFMHCEIEERLKRSHKNDDIDKDKTAGNLSAFGLSYTDLCKKYDRRINPLIINTEKKNGRKLRSDAVHCSCSIVYVPDTLNDTQKKQFVNAVFDYYKREFGANYIEGFYHQDEIHDYINPKTKEVVSSLGHIHNFVIPEVDNCLNAKKFINRKRINDLNKFLNDYCMREFGVPYMTGAGKEEGKSVEEMKREQVELLKENEKTIKEQAETIKKQTETITNNTEFINNQKENVKKFKICTELLNILLPILNELSDVLDNNISAYMPFDIKARKSVNDVIDKLNAFENVKIKEYSRNNSEER